MAQRKRLTDAQIYEAYGRYRGGMTADEVGAEFGVSYMTLYRGFKRLKLPLKEPQATYSDEQIREAHTLYMQGKDQAEVSAITGITQAVLSTRFRALGLPTRRKGKITMDTEQTVEQGQIESVKFIIGELEKVVAGTRKTGWGDSTDIEDNLLDIADRLISISQAGYPDTFREWMESNFTREEFSDMLNFGINTGWAGLTWYSDLSRLYDKYEDEIWEALYDDAQGYGHDNVGEFFADWNTSDFGTDLQFRGALVHYMVERVARDIVKGGDEEEGDDDA